MTSDDILLVIKQRVGQALSIIGAEDPEYDDYFIFEYVYTTWLDLTALGIDTGVTVDKDTLTVTPATSTVIGMLLAYGTAKHIIEDDMLDKLRDGELGVSFRTGTTEVTTNQAAITLTNAATALKKSYELLLTKYLAGDPDSVVQRIQ